MSKHSKNSNSQTIFTYGERQKLKGLYGTRGDRISQDSIKRFEMCTICINRIIEPVCCDKGHVFCRNCAIEYMVEQKKKISEMNAKFDEDRKKKEERQMLKKAEEEAQKIVKFEKYDNFEELNKRNQFFKEENQEEANSGVKPIGMYDLTFEKDHYLKSSFWTIENTPAADQKVQKKTNFVTCPSSNHKLTLKKLRNLQIKEVETQFCCAICSKEIGRQKIGSYQCGHIVCFSCKSDKCEVCSEKMGWIEVESSQSAFASHSKAEVKTYSHAFYM